MPITQQPGVAQKNVAVNSAIGCVFFEDSSLCYNYKTGQWSRISAFVGQGLYSFHDDEAIIGRVWFVSDSGSLTDSRAIKNPTIQEATLETAEIDLNTGGRAMVDGVRPLARGGTHEVRVGVRNNLTDSVTYSTGTSINARTGMSHFRNAENRAEGRYQRLNLKSTVDHEVILGADVVFMPTGGV
jgi:hypothetical protein